ncbi:DUF1796 family putative cysteine peptidase [Anaerocolumna sp. MB42-C2]|uniref:DUF1796 family putative cysteine peptidase n=1 Tax=Anaerocolumna sp. MB42-C2 TaxID=3070997 RepID=UPI0027E05C29|nr:DUF1796 family putative cysteine peptidase [Anaerocolumna sp. MB42-C2]WMJ90165.1 DUF1796 family putative cysteine peptidase [Anaerocolumna sp. MB42-C2]
MYDYFISLGCYCGIAASMSALGLRSQSGPFDWCSSDFNGVIDCIKNEFVDMLDVTNLQIIRDKPRHFLDTKYNFYFMHELSVSETLEEKYSDILSKYKKRQITFLEMIHKPTCFIRAIRNEIEIEYIKNNSDTIIKTLRKYNQRNNIIYIVTENLKEQASFLHPYIINKYSGESKEALMGTFEQRNDDLKIFCLNNINKTTLVNNLYFEKEKQEKQLNAFKLRYSLINQLLTIKNNNIRLKLPEDYYQSNQREIIIYGAGNIGKSIYEEIKSYTNIKCFIDQFNSDVYYDNIPIISLKDLKQLNIMSSNFVIIITPIWDIENIKKTIKCFLGDMEYKIISLQDVLNLSNQL